MLVKLLLLQLANSFYYIEGKRCGEILQLCNDYLVLNLYVISYQIAHL